MSRTPGSRPGRTGIQQRGSPSAAAGFAAGTAAGRGSWRPRLPSLRYSRRRSRSRQGGGGQTFTSTNRYTLLVRNSGNGNGGATAQTCNTTPTAQACENNVNSGTGLAATYRTRGLVAAQFQTSGSGQATPFTISDNATGMVRI